MTSPHEREAEEYGREHFSCKSAYLAGMHGPGVEKLVEALREVAKGHTIFKDVGLDENSRVTFSTEILVTPETELARDALVTWEKGKGG